MKTATPTSTVDTHLASDRTNVLFRMKIDAGPILLKYQETPAAVRTHRDFTE